MPAPEATARESIDAQLGAAGWSVQDIAEINLSASQGVAVRELRSKGGPADYISTAPEKRRRPVGVLDGMSEANAARRVSRRAELANQFRIAVTVDMIATVTDIKPLECLLFLRDVRSQLYFEQMKGRGTRTIDPTDLATVTPDAGSKTRFVLVDAVGVTESDKTDSRPLERKPTIAFEKLLTNIALGHRDEDTLTSLANRLARLDQPLDEKDKAELQSAGGISLKQLASDLLQATDPDRALDQFQAEHGPDQEPTEKQLDEQSTAARDRAVVPIASQPDFRKLLEEKRSDREVTLDHRTGDELISAGYDGEKARQLVTSWKQFLDANQDETTALQILYNKPHAKRQTQKRSGRCTQTFTDLNDQTREILCLLN